LGLYDLLLLLLHRIPQQVRDADFTVRAFPTLRVGIAYVFRLAANNNGCALIFPT
jgi:hypothetical protein